MNKKLPPYYIIGFKTYIDYEKESVNISPGRWSLDTLDENGNNMEISSDTPISSPLKDCLRGTEQLKNNQWYFVFLEKAKNKTNVFITESWDIKTNPEKIKKYSSLPVKRLHCFYWL